MSHENQRTGVGDSLNPTQNLGASPPSIAGRISAYFGSSKGTSDHLSSDIPEPEIDYVPGGLLGELDAQQDDVIRRLDELNFKIERLMREWKPSSVDDTAGDDTPGDSGENNEAA